MVRMQASCTHAEEIVVVIFLSRYHTTEVMQPSKKPFDFPTAAIATQSAPVLGFWLAAVDLVRCQILVPLPRFVLPTPEPPFSQH